MISQMLMFALKDALLNIRVLSEVLNTVPIPEVTTGGVC